MAAKRASARAAEPTATEPMRKGGGSVEAGADDNQRIMTSDSFLPNKPVIMQLSADPSDSSFAAPHKRRKPSVWTNCLAYLQGLSSPLSLILSYPLFKRRNSSQDMYTSIIFLDY